MSNVRKIILRTTLAGGVSFAAILHQASAEPSEEQATPPYWITTSSGCKVWNPKPAKNESVEWSGQCINGFANGEGNLKWYRDGEINQVTTCHMVSGHAQGMEKRIYKNGDSFEGSVRDDLANGLGVYRFHGGGDYTGWFLNNEFDGHGTLHYSDGNVYVGQWKNGKREGRGVQSFADGSRYEGFWADGKYEGFGEYRFSDGSLYKGDWHLGKKNGQGTQTSASGAIKNYTGTWKNDFADGSGTLTFTNGDEYTGEISEGYREGQGTLIFADGAKYIGHFKHGQRDGYGVYISTDRSRYEGQWIADQQRGNGTFYDVKGNVTKATRGGTVNLIAQGGVYKVPVTINGKVTLNFVIDSGAADVSIPADVVRVMFRSGTLTDGDFIGSQNYVQADGSIVPSATFRIKTLQVGDHLIKDVIGSVSDVRGELLLGQSFLSRLPRWSLNNSDHVLEIEESGIGQ